MVVAATVTNNVVYKGSIREKSVRDEICSLSNGAVLYLLCITAKHRGYFILHGDPFI